MKYKSVYSWLFLLILAITALLFMGLTIRVGPKTAVIRMEFVKWGNWGIGTSQTTYKQPPDFPTKRNAESWRFIFLELHLFTEEIVPKPSPKAANKAPS